MAGVEGLEPPTVRFEAEYSIQLSYTPTQGAKDNSEQLTFLVMLFFEQVAKERAAIIWTYRLGRPTAIFEEK